MFVKDPDRKLARVVKIDAIKPIEKADFLEIAVVEGWECVVVKGLCSVGEEVLYLEIDSAIRLDSPVFNTFDKQYLKVSRDPVTQQDYAVIKTIRLRGALSQGLIMTKVNYASVLPDARAGDDVTEDLEVLKYLTPSEARLYRLAVDELDDDASLTKKLIWRLRNWLIKDIVVDGFKPFPAGHVKSDEKRLQNSVSLYNQMVAFNNSVELSIKLDGESATIYTDLTTQAVSVAQRNYGLVTQDVPWTFKESVLVYLSGWVYYVARTLRGGRARRPKWARCYRADSVPLVKYFKENDFERKLTEANHPDHPIQKFLKERTAAHKLTGPYKIALQGEMVGPDFNANAEKLQENRLYVYRVYLNGNYCCQPAVAKALCEQLDFDYIPLQAETIKLPTDFKDCLKLADGKAVWDPNGRREGLVVKSHVTGESFKVISNKWLEKKKDE